MHLPNSIVIANAQRLSDIYGPAQLSEIGQLSSPVCGPVDRDQVCAKPELLREVEVIFGGWGMPELSEELLCHSPKLKAVFYGAGTVKKFVSEAFWRRGIVLTNAHFANAIPVAEFCLSTILFSLKLGWRQMRSVGVDKVWCRDLDINGTFGADVGLISLGAVGRKTVELLKPFNVNLLAHSIDLTPELAEKLGVELCSLEEIFKRSEVVSLHTPELDSTRGMVRAEHFLSMRKNATFINTARGAVVNQAEMVAALRERPDLTAILDVLDPEPPEPGSEILDLPNVFITPHIAGSQGRECRRLGQTAIEEFKRFVAGEPLLHPVSEEDLQSMA